MQDPQLIKFIVVPYRKVKGGGVRPGDMRQASTEFGAVRVPTRNSLVSQPTRCLSTKRLGVWTPRVFCSNMAPFLRWMSRQSQGLSPPPSHFERKPIRTKMTTLSELLEMRNSLDQQIAETRRAASQDAIAQIKALMMEFELTAEDLGFSAAVRRRERNPARYRDPETGKTWTGLGREPKWIKGQEREKFLIAHTDNAA